MEGTKYLTKGDVLKRAQEIIGIPLKEVDRIPDASRPAKVRSVL